MRVRWEDTCGCALAVVTHSSGPPWGHRAQLPGIAFGSLCVCTPTSLSRSVQITNPVCVPPPHLKSTGAGSPLTSVNQQNSPDTECLAHRKGSGWYKWWWCWWQLDTSSHLTSVNQQNSPDTECLAHRTGFGHYGWLWCWWQWLLRYSHSNETMMSWLWYDGDRQPWWGWGEDGNDDGDNSSDNGDIAWWYDGDINMILFILPWCWWYMI